MSCIIRSTPRATLQARAARRSLLCRMRVHAVFARSHLESGDRSAALDSIMRIVGLAKLADSPGARSYAQAWIDRLTAAMRAARPPYHQIGA